METHILFFILAGIFIAILVGYSLWSARREKSRIDTFAMRPVSAPTNSVPSSIEPPVSVQPQPSEEFMPQQPAVDNAEQWEHQEQEIQAQVQNIKIKIAPSNEPEAKTEPVFANEPQVHIQPEPEVAVNNQEQEQTENNLITLYVVAPQGSYFNGAIVVQQLEALGLQFGEYHIFHRHLDNSNSPVLFSVANMMQPGIFDLNNIEQFTTVGLVLFMQLPSPTNDLANLKIMLNTADSLAQSLGGFILNDQQQLLDDNARHAYFQRVRSH